MSAEFVHLHNHSEYSLLDGTTRFVDEKGKPSDFMKWVAAQQMPAIAFTDHGNLYGAIEFYLAANEVGVRPIIGCEAYIAKGSRLDRDNSRRENCHLTLLAKDMDGYRNLMALVSAGFLEGFYYDPRIDKELLAKHSKGLIALSGCLKSEVGQALTDGSLSEAEKLVGEYSDILGKGNYFLEVMDHGLDKQRKMTEGLLEIAKRTGLPLAATNDCHYFKKDDWEAHDARVCISTGRLLSDTNRLKFESHEFYFKTAEEMARTFKDIPEAVRNTLAVADACRLKIPTDQILLPHYQVPGDHTVDSYLELLCRKGLAKKGKAGPEFDARLKYELGIIQKMGFSAYFLIVWDFIAYARSQGIPVGPGRGSGAGSLVAFALDITKVDPLEHRLLFERFLNPDRKSMPDLDIDFSDEGRERVIEYVRGKYGSGNVAQIITFGTMAARLVVRDVGRVLGFPLPEVDRLAKLIPAGPGQSLLKAVKEVPELAEAAHKDPRVKKLFDLGGKLEGLRRHTGVHAAGTIITKEPVVSYAPLAKNTNSEVVTTQYDDVSLLKLGLLKVDFLGLRNLSVIAHAVEFIRQRVPGFDIEKLPMTDDKSFELLQKARTFGVFQLESHGMRDLLWKLKPTTFDDISAVIALYRPGPMQAGMLDDFVARKHGHKKVVFDHPLLEEILKDTYGCLVFQEQVMEISKRLAGFSPGEADGLRKAMGKKIPEEMEKARGKFVEGCAKNKIKDKLANKIFDTMVTFGGYGFNKSHTVAYALVSWQTAYLKAHYPLEFMTALLSSEIGRSAIGAEDKENKVATYLTEAKAMGLTALPPDVNRSRARFSVEREGPGVPAEGAIRFGLEAVKNVGRGVVESIEKARAEGGPFGSLDDFCRRVDLRQANKKVLESLVKAGALDGLMPGVPPEESRAVLLSSLEETVGRQSRLKEDLKVGQGFLFGAGDLPAPAAAKAESPKRLSEHELLQFEREVLGFYFSGHPLTRLKDQLDCAATHSVGTLPKTPGVVRVAGMLTNVKRLVTKEKGEQWARCTLEDLTGEVPLLVFPKAYAQGLGKMLKTGEILAVQGRISVRGDGEAAETEIICEEILPMERAVEKWAAGLVIRLSTAALEEEEIESLRNVLSKHPGRCPVSLVLETPGHGTAIVDTAEHVRPASALLDDLEKVLGERSFSFVGPSKKSA